MMRIGRHQSHHLNIMAMEPACECFSLSRALSHGSDGMPPRLDHGPMSAPFAAHQHHHDAARLA